MSFTVQAAVVALALAIPLLYPSSLPDAVKLRRIFVPITSPDVEPTVANANTQSGHTGVSVPFHRILVTQERGFHFTGRGPAPSGLEGPPNIVLGSSGPLAPSGLNLGDHVATILPRPAPVTPARVSRSMQGYLIHRVDPDYPSIAKLAGVQGVVLIKAVISTAGRIEQLQVVKGSPLLSQAALQAIRQWRYRPYYLNDEPVEVETEITVNFFLDR
jgi:periplasmic protein TonB